MYLCDGWSTIVQAYATPGGVEIIPYVRARSVKLPKLDGGAPIDTHTMYNREFVTKAANGLAEYGDVTMQCQYDVQAYVAIYFNLLNTNRWYVISLPDKSSFAFWGCMYGFDPAELRKGEFPLAEVSIGLLNREANSGTETGATVTANNAGNDSWPPTPRPRGTLNR